MLSQNSATRTVALGERKNRASGVSAIEDPVMALSQQVRRFIEVVATVGV